METENKQDIAVMKSEFAHLRRDVTGLRTEVKDGFKQTSQEIKLLRADFASQRDLDEVKKILKYKADLKDLKRVERGQTWAFRFLITQAVALITILALYILNRI